MQQKRNSSRRTAGSTRLAGVVAALMLACSRSGVAPPAATPQDLADLALLDGVILTMDANETVAQALAIRDGVILAVGSNAAILPRVGEHTEVLQLGGRAVTPGLIDSHCHFAAGAIDREAKLDLGYPATGAIADVVASVAAGVAQRRAGEWVEGSGWDEGKLAERRYVYASDIDPVSPDNPVWLVHTMGHYGTANARALERANITRDTADPPGGSIDRYPDGTPTGVLKETAMELVSGAIPEPTDAQIRAAIANLAGDFNAECMTALKDPGIDDALWQAYQRVNAEGALTVRVFALWSAGRSVEEAQRLARRVGPFTHPDRSTGDDRLISGGIKIVLDGSGGARTAWLYDAWNREYDQVDRGNRGYPLIDPQIFREQVMLFHAAGLHVGVHAIGDRAIDWTLDTYAEALAQTPTYGLRHGVIHANLPTAHALERMATLQKQYDAGIPEVSPGFMWWIGDTYAGNWGRERSLGLIPLRTFLTRGIRWGSSSDYPVTPFPARYGIWASVARKTLLGVYGANPYGMTQAVDVQSALHAYTDWNARQLFLEEKIGSLEPGKYADVAVWDRHPGEIDTDAIQDMRCLLTLLEGKIVHRAAGASFAAAPGTLGGAPIPAR
ncbi:MAG: amidohydrolase [Myxococcales bacterium]|nr:amidohydrolase [Myxococcales bacterium]